MSQPIKYLGGGMLGDFIQQLSIVYEKFLETNTPCILYIADHGDNFKFSVQTTFEDLLPIVSRQSYILEFKIHNDEPFDVDLSAWRESIYDKSYIDCMKHHYGIDWGRISGCTIFQLIRNGLTLL